MSKRILMVSLLALTAAYNLTYAAAREREFEAGMRARQRLVTQGLALENDALFLANQHRALKNAALREEAADRARARRAAEQAEAERQAAAQRQAAKEKEDAIWKRKIIRAMDFVDKWSKENAPRLDPFMKEVIGLYRAGTPFPHAVEKLLEREETISRALEIYKRELRTRDFTGNLQLKRVMQKAVDAGVAGLTYSEALQEIETEENIQRSHQEDLLSQKRQLLLEHGIDPHQFTREQIDAMSKEEIIKRFGRKRK